MWQIQGQCIATAESPGSFGSASTFTTFTNTDTSWGDVATKTLTTSDVLSGCAASEMFLFRLFRDAQHASDTLAAAVELILADFQLSQ